MTILVTGSAGHLGTALMRRLRAQGQTGIGLDLRASPETDRIGAIGDRMLVRAAMTGVRAVLHTATLHKPQLATHSKQDFVDVNVTGTLVLLEEAVRAGVAAFVCTSTTSVYGAALTPPPDAPAAWVTEATAPEPRTIYGATKHAAEDLCALFHREAGLPAIVLRTARFFTDADAQSERLGITDANLHTNELLNRRVALEDAVDAHFAALERAPALGFARYVVSATTPFAAGDRAALRRDAAGVVHRLFPDCARLYAARGWRLFPTLDRVYDNTAARRDLGWRPRHDFAGALSALATEETGTTAAR